jgi:hypothetical protein
MVNVGGTTASTGGSSSTGGTTAIDPCAMNLTKTSWDVTSDFSVTKNPCGVWTYGYKSNATSPNLVVYSAVYTIDFGSGGLGHSWNDPNNLNGGDKIPSIFQNPATNTTINGVEPGQVALHGGANGEASLVRFTAPRAGTYSVSVSFFSGDIWETTGNIVQGTESIYSIVTSMSPSYSRDFQLQVGETIDVTVMAQSNGSGGWFYAYGSTPITVTVTEN